MFSGVEGSFLSHNLFAYCLNNPVNLSDSGGNLPTWAKKLAIAAAVVVTVAAVAAVTVATGGATTALACAAVGAAKGAAIGFVTGAVSGAATGAVTHIVTTGSTVGIGDAMLNGMADGALTGAISGAVTGALTSPYCFVAGTAVLAAAGAVAIETIQAGDMVWAWDEETGEVGLKEVVETYINETNELVHILIDGEEIITTSKSDTTSISGGFKLPHTFGIGVLYDYNSNWKFGIDYTYQGWGSSSFFGYDKGVNRSKVSVGAEYSPNQLSRNIFKRMNYRMGAFYAQPYNEVNGQEGCEEYGASIGVTIPIVNRVNNRSLLHISGQVIRMSPKSDGMIAETYLRLNVGITFNESWFMKLKLR